MCSVGSDVLHCVSNMFDVQSITAQHFQNIPSYNIMWSRVFNICDLWGVIVRHVLKHVDGSNLTLQLVLNILDV